MPFEYDDATFKEAVSSSQILLQTACDRARMQTMKYNGTEYYIEPETYGNEFDDADLQVMVKDTGRSRWWQLAASAAGYRRSNFCPESFYYRAGCHKGRRMR